MYIGAFDIGGTKTIIALTDETGFIYEKEQFATDASNCYLHLDKCVGIFRDFLKNRELLPEQVAGVGVNLPGIVDRETGTLVRAVYAGWKMIPVGSYLSERLNIRRIICENDVNSCAVGELRFGLGKKYRSFAWITVSTGVGGAVVCNGQLIRGAHGYAGEFGHLKVEYENPEKCPCGQYGCLEAHGSGTAISREIVRRTQVDVEFASAFRTMGTEVTGAACASLARSGHPVAREIYAKAAEYLGRGISSYINVMDPEAVIIGGGVAAAMDLLEPGIRKAIDRCAFLQMKEVPVLVTELGYEAALMGAVAIAVNDMEGK